MKRGYELYIRKILFVSKLALVIVLGYLIVTAVMTTTKSTEVFAPGSVSADNLSGIENPMPPTTSPESYSDIVEQNIFSGLANSSDPEDSLPGGSASNTFESAGRELGLALTGTVAGSPIFSRAVIKNLGTNVMAMYKQGDTVATAKIQSIQDNQVVLVHQGQQKVLNLGFAFDEQTKPTDNKVTLKQETTEPLNTMMQTPEPLEIAKTGFGQIETILKKAVISPHLVNGKMEGLRIDGLEQIKGAGILGLKNGDVVRSVNGHLLTSRQKAFQVFKKSRSQPNIDIELLRDEKIETLSFSLK